MSTTKNLEIINASVSENTNVDVKRLEKEFRKTQRRLKLKKFLLNALAIIAVIAFAFINVFLVRATINKAADQAYDSFNSTKNEIASNVYKAFYQKAFDAAEETHHISDNTTIVLENIKKVQLLEVLQVSDQICEIWGDDSNETLDGFIKEDIESWIVLSGSGVFTVNLNYAEFITDNTQQYVLVRVPTPHLTHFSLDDGNEVQFEFKSSLNRFSSVDTGETVMRIQRGNAVEKMWHNIENNQILLQAAKESTEKILRSLIVQLNPHLPNLTIEFEFVA